MILLGADQHDANILKMAADNHHNDIDKVPSQNQWPLSFESSDVDWCESNFQITYFVAEFWNTISNVLFFILPPILIHLHREYSLRVSWGVNVVWALLGIVGVGSVYFHATLSLVGQLLDEIAIIWVVMASIAMWFPKEFMPLFMHQDRGIFQVWVVAFTFVTTGLACIKPAINCVMLFILGVPATWLLILHLKNCDIPRVYNLGIRCAITWICALLSWGTDSLFCPQWKYIGFPYMHCFWHIFIALASYQAIVLFAYFDAMVEVPEMNPVLRYWPYDCMGFFGIPCVLFETDIKVPSKLEKVL